MSRPKKRNIPPNSKISIFNQKQIISLFQEKGIKLINLHKIYKLLIKDGELCVSAHVSSTVSLVSLVVCLLLLITSSVSLLH